MEILGPAMFANLVEMCRYYFGNAYALFIDRTTAQSAALVLALQFARVALPIMMVLLAGGVAINLAQVGFVASAQALTPNFERLNPVAGLSRYFSARAFVEFVKSLFKLAVVSYIVYLTLRNRWDHLLELMQPDPLAIVQETAALVVLVWFRVVAAMLVIGLLDYAFQRWQYERDLRMTVQEAREEMRELEGDPRIRQRVRQIQRQLAMQRMMREVPTADVIITNPITYAVALRYDAERMGAPVVTAKGARRLAERIQKIARENSVPVVQRPELARTLYRTVEIGQAIPENLFRIVAEVLAYIYQIDRRRDKQQERREGLRTARADVSGTR